MTTKLYRNYLLPMILAASMGFLPQAWSAELNISGRSEVFFPKAAALNASEVQAGALAARKACRMQVRAYGQLLQRDHQKARQEIALFSRGRNIQLMRPAFEPWEFRNVQLHHRDMNRLMRMRGCAFDREFLLSMRKGHIFAQQVYRNALYSSRDYLVRLHIQRTLPVIQQHLNRATRLLLDL
jgi:putative membrane protein